MREGAQCRARSATIDLVKESADRMHCSSPPLRARFVVLAGLAIAGCGQHKVQRSDQPAAITTTTAAGSSAATGPARAAATGTFPGADVVTKFGDVQVSLTLSRGRIVDVQWLKLPFDRPRSQSISQQASPILRSEVLSAQSAHINVLSGATYTSEAWANSVQSALNRTH
jgi:uncharacterized protein with FMN-binding domain